MKPVKLVLMETRVKLSAIWGSMEKRAKLFATREGFDEPRETIGNEAIHEKSETTCDEVIHEKQNETIFAMRIYMERAELYAMRLSME